MNSFKVYLAGYISGSKLEQCAEWRRKIRSFYALKSWNDLIFLDPLNGKEFATITKDGLHSSIPSHAIIHRDYQSVINSNLVIANLDTFGDKRPITGTIAELAWAWEHKISIILITTEEQYKSHPFLEYFASIIVNNVDELLNKRYLDYFYQGTVNAKY